jgi:hypothetical protein
MKAIMNSENLSTVESLDQFLQGNQDILRGSLGYKKHRQVFTKTQSRKVNIVEWRKPEPNGQPGYIRIDSVHQGDLDKQKGVYHINAVDEVTQFEMVGSVEKISEAYLMPILAQMQDNFPL